jgi:hypothetical protein
MEPSSRLRISLKAFLAGAPNKTGMILVELQRDSVLWEQQNDEQAHHNNLTASSIRSHTKVHCRFNFPQSFANRICTLF